MISCNINEFINWIFEMITIKIQKVMKYLLEL